ncbi:MAG: hypothetical protein LBH28_04985 [Oscillospiraceae bacterium]|jgi:aspartyl-tRNA(Asn)/glutamyl-tRNA(Gln) amidotransferase subunit C|nr:hypothetical protein [Oscillospiraceae bacterium]
MITSDELTKIAKLAKLSLAGENIDALVADMADIISLAQSICDADLSNLDRTWEDAPATLRGDVVLPSLPADLILANAAAKREGHFVARTGGGKAEC